MEKSSRLGEQKRKERRCCEKGDADSTPPKSKRGIFSCMNPTGVGEDGLRKKKGKGSLLLANRSTLKRCSKGKGAVSATQSGVIKGKAFFPA